MQTPPPLPQSTPPAPSARKGTGASWVKIALIAVVALVAGCAVLIFGAIQLLKGVKKDADIVAAKAEQVPAPPPLTEAQKGEAKAFGKKLAELLSSGEARELAKLADVQTTARRGTAGLHLGDAGRTAFVRELNQKPGGILAALSGIPTRFLKVTERDGFPAITLRCSPESGGLNFVDVLFTTSGGGFKYIDLYTYLFGAMATTEARNAMLMAGPKDKGAVSSLLGLEDADAPDADALLDFVSDAGDRKPADTIKAYDKLPAKLKSNRLPFIAYVTALTNGRSDPKIEALYIQALEKAPSILGNGAAPDLLLIDSHLASKNYKAAMKCCDNLLELVGEDAALYQLRGTVAVLAGNATAAEASLLRGLKLEPDLLDLVDLRLQLSALKKDFAGVAEELRRCAAERHINILPEMLTDAIYDDFKKSPEFDEWAASLKEK